MADEIIETHEHKEHPISYIIPVALIAGLVALLWIVSGQPVEELDHIVPEEKYLFIVVGYLVIGAEAAAAIVIGAAFIQALIHFFRHLFDDLNRQINYTERIRLRLGHMLNLGLEFAMGSDILRIAVSPTTSDVIMLFSIVLLRILLNYFLEREIRSSEEFCGPGNYIPDID